MNNESETSTTIQRLCQEYRENNVITKEEYQRHRVKRGLRNDDGTGVMAGVDPRVQRPRLPHRRRGQDPRQGAAHLPGHRHRGHRGRCEAEDRFGFEEVAWLLIFGKLPNRRQFDRMCKLLYDNRELPEYFPEGHDHQGPQ